MTSQDSSIVWQSDYLNLFEQNNGYYGIFDLSYGQSY